MPRRPDETGVRGRREVLNEARRQVERALASAPAAEELAQAAQALLDAAEAGQIELDAKPLADLRAALAKYRKLAGG
jgi:hypothetical protein